MNMHPAALKLFHVCGQRDGIKELTTKIKGKIQDRTNTSRE
jgi:hypothetical protein